MVEDYLKDLEVGLLDSKSEFKIENSCYIGIFLME